MQILQFSEWWSFIKVPRKQPNLDQSSHNKTRPDQTTSRKTRPDQTTSRNTNQDTSEKAWYDKTIPDQADQTLVRLNKQSQLDQTKPDNRCRSDQTRPDLTIPDQIRPVPNSPYQTWPNRPRPGHTLLDRMYNFICIRLFLNPILHPAWLICHALTL